MAPQDDAITPSLLTKFRKLRLKDTGLMSLLIGKNVAIALEKGIIKFPPPHIALSEERIITGAIVTSDEKDDGPFLQSLVGDSIKNAMEADTIMGDSAYSGKDNLAFGQKNLSLL